MFRIEQAPRYVQGADALQQLGELIRPFGRTFYIITGQTAGRAYGAALSNAIAPFGSAIFAQTPCQACTRTAIADYVREASARHCDAVIGMGGGKVIDVTKMTAFELQVPMILMPTVASSDAPCSSLSILYDETGAVCAVECLGRHPDLVVVDSRIIAESPPRMLVCGMGDALSTYFEARTCREHDFRNTFGGQIPGVALAVARACLDTLYSDGLDALDACRRQAVTPALDRVIEANTYMSTLGFECGGVSCAHAFQDALSQLDVCTPYYHGELVAFGTLCLLTAEGRAQREIEEARRFCHQTGLPITLRELGLQDDVHRQLLSVKDVMCPRGDTAHCVPNHITPDLFVDAVLAADEAGEQYHKNHDTVSKRI